RRSQSHRGLDHDSAGRVGARPTVSATTDCVAARRPSTTDDVPLVTSRPESAGRSCEPTAGHGGRDHPRVLLAARAPTHSQLVVGKAALEHYFGHHYLLEPEVAGARVPVDELPDLPPRIEEADLVEVRDANQERPRRRGPHRVTALRQLGPPWIARA